MSCFFDDDPTLNWATVYEGSGVGRQIIYTRRKATNKKKKATIR